MKSGIFCLKWRHTTTGSILVASYYYDGLSNQKGYSRTGWILSCIYAGKQEGSEYLGMVPESQIGDWGEGVGWLGRG
jgi:hypothetical protein